MIALVLIAAAAFIATSLWMARLLRTSSNWWLMAVAGVALAGSWGTLLWLRIPRAVDVMATFLLADLSIFVLGVLAMMRLLGAFEQRFEPDEGSDDGGSAVPNDPHPTHPSAPAGPRHPLHPSSSGGGPTRPTTPHPQAHPRRSRPRRPARTRT